jgi:hypothetical protein
MSQSDLDAREVYQLLKDVALGTRRITNTGDTSWNQVYSGNITLEVDGWTITLYNDCGELDYCDACVSPDGRIGTFETWSRFGTDPIQLLSQWERGQIEARLQEL